MGDEKTDPAKSPSSESGEPPSLADELGIEDLNDPIFGARGRLFSAAGRQSPIAEFTPRFLILHPPQVPFQDEGPAEDIAFRVDARGILLDEFNQPRKIVGARYKSNALFWFGKQKPGTTKYFAAWFDKDGKPHLLYVNGEPITTDIVFRLRNKTHDGEISIFPDLESDDKTSQQAKGNPEGKPTQQPQGNPEARPPQQSGGGGPEGRPPQESGGGGPEARPPHQPDGSADDKRS